VFTGWAQDDVDSGFSGDPSPDGALLGLNAGYNWQSGPWVYGVEGDVAWTDLSERGDNGLKSDVKNTATLRGKIGYSTGRWLPYATVGYTVADVDYSVPGASDSETVDGYTVGIGTEYAVNQNWSLKGEYQYSDLQGDIDHKIDQVRLGVNYNF
jgi:outer membrane immunogenic protein